MVIKKKIINWKNIFNRRIKRVALVAQLVEHFLGKEEVTGSIPVEGSRIAAYTTIIGSLIS